MAKAVEGKIGHVFPFQDPAIDTFSSCSRLHDPALPTRVYDLGIGWHTDYLRVLKLYLKEEKQAANVATLILRLLMLLLYPKIVAIHSRCAMIRWKFRGLQDKTLFGFRRDAFINGLPNERFHLRALVEDFEDDLNYLWKYLRSQVSSDTLSDRSWLKVEEDLIETRQEASRFQAEVRDWLQLQVGEWALQESKKSIELSNRQIEKGKRGQLLVHSDHNYC